MRRLEGRAALIAGAGGIGSACAKRVASEGARVALGDINLASAQKTASEIEAAGGKCIAIQYDQRDEAQIKNLIEETKRAYGRIDCVHVNAADLAMVRVDTTVLDIDLDVYDRTIQVNQRGPVLVTRHVLPHLIESKGAIVYTSSDAANVGEPQRFAYAMTKAALNALMRHVASLAGPKGVRANSILPGFILFPENRDIFSGEYLAEHLKLYRSDRLGEPNDIASMLAMLFSDDGAWICGQSLSVNGGISMR